jgi:hypothetical protein
MVYLRLSRHHSDDKQGDPQVRVGVTNNEIIKQDLTKE